MDNVRFDNHFVIGIGMEGGMSDFRQAKSFKLVCLDSSKQVGAGGR